MLVSNKGKISASLMCTDPYNLKEELDILEKEQIDYLHMDIIDGHFVSNFGLSLDFVSQIRKHTHIPFDFHLMVENPINIIHRLNLQKGEIISIHFESTYYLKETIDLIRQYEAKLFMAINPLTPICILDDIYSYIDGINLLTVTPGFAGQSIVDTVYKKAQRLQTYLKSRSIHNFEIEVDGNMNFKNVEIFKRYGATIFVAGTSSIFPNNQLNVEQIRNFKKYL